MIIMKRMRIMVSKQQRRQTDAAAPNCCSSRSSTGNSTSPAAAASSCSQQQQQQLKVFSTASLRSKLKAALVWRLPDHDSSSSSMSTTTTSTTTTTTTISSQTLSKESSSQVDSSANYSTSSSSSSVTSSQQQQVLGIKDMLSDGAIIFKLKDLSMATENFHPAKKVGNSVFRGSLHGMDVAVVVLKNNSNKGSGGGGPDFVAEMKNLCSVHHTNLVKLIGGCSNVQHGRIYLVYEFIIASGNL